MPQDILKAEHINRTVLTERVANNLAPGGATVDSNIADFRNMKVGWVQVWYKNADAYDGSFELFVSGYPDPDSFSKYPDSLNIMDSDCQSLGWDINVLGFRYAFLRYYKGPTITTGSMEIIAIGKK